MFEYSTAHRDINHEYRTRRSLMYTSATTQMRVGWASRLLHLVSLYALTINNPLFHIDQLLYFEDLQLIAELRRLIDIIKPTKPMIRKEG